MADKVEFELVSPEKLLVSQPVRMVVVPGADGYFGVLPGHAPMIVTVKPGVIDVYGEDMNAVTERVFVAGGFAEVTDTRCTVLAEEAVDVTKIDRAAVEKQVADLTEDLGEATGEFERKTIAGKLAVAQAKLDAVGAAAA